MGRVGKPKRSLTHHPQCSRLGIWFPALVCCTYIFCVCVCAGVKLLHAQGVYPSELLLGVAQVQVHMCDPK